MGSFANTCTTSTATVRTGIQVVSGQWVPAQAMRFCRVLSRDGIGVKQGMFSLCRYLKVGWVYAGAVVTDVMQLFALWYFAVVQLIAIAMRHFSEARAFLSDGIEHDSCVPIGGNKSMPLPAAIREYRVMVVEVLDGVLSLKAWKARLAVLPTQYIVDGVNATLIYIGKLWGIAASCV